MAYAIRKDKKGYRVVDSEPDISEDEYFSEIPIEICKDMSLCIREKRDAYLHQCDAVTNRHRDQVDASLPTTITNAQYLEVLALKQTLRDIPQQSGFPDNVTWPSIPSFLE